MFFTLSQYVCLYECWVCVHAASLKVIVLIRCLVSKICCRDNPVLENSCASITLQKAVMFNDSMAIMLTQADTSV